MVSDTSARPSAALWAVPAKITSSIFVERTALGAWAPSTQATASTTLDLPLPLGPTTTVTPGSRRIEAVSAKDLKPFSVSVFRYTSATLVGAEATSGHPRQCSRQARTSAVRRGRQTWVSQ